MVDKRGDVENTLYFIIIQVVLLVIVFIAVFGLANSYIDNTVFWKNYFSKDIAYLSEISQTQKGDVVLAYELNYAENPLSIRLGEGYAEVNDIPPGDALGVRTHFSITSAIAVVPGEQIGYLTLVKENSQLSIMPTEGGSILACNTISTQVPKPRVRIQTGQDTKLQQVGTAITLLLEDKQIATTGNRQADLQVILDQTSSSSPLSVGLNGNALPKSTKLYCLVSYLSADTLSGWTDAPVSQDTFTDTIPGIHIQINQTTLASLDTNAFALQLGNAIAAYFAS